MDMISKVGGAILLAETEWTPKSGVSKERAMAIAALEAMREPTEAMTEAAAVVLYGATKAEAVEWAKLEKFEDRQHGAAEAYTAMIDAALAS